MSAEAPNSSTPTSWSTPSIHPLDGNSSAHTPCWSGSRTITAAASARKCFRSSVTVTKKVATPLSAEDASARIRELSAWRVFAPTADDVVAAIALHTEAKIGFWDAMIVLAAAESGCDVLWTEDLNDGQVLRGVRIRDPFADRS